MTILVPELLTTDVGIYCITPRRNGKDTLYKIGMTQSSLLKRMNTYGICYPEGLYIDALVVCPINQVREIETKIHKHLTKLGHHVKYKALADDGNTVTRNVGEWFNVHPQVLKDEIVKLLTIPSSSNSIRQGDRNPRVITKFYNNQKIEFDEKGVAKLTPQQLKLRKSLTNQKLKELRKYPIYNIGAVQSGRYSTGLNKTSRPKRTIKPSTKYEGFVSLF